MKPFEHASPSRAPLPRLRESKPAKRRPAFTEAQIRRAEEALARVGVTRSLRAQGSDRLDFVELHVDQLVQLVQLLGEGRS